MRCAIRVAVAAAALAPAGLAAQSARLTGVTSVQYVQLRPLALDSVPVADAPGDGLIRRTADGHLVRCITGELFCRFTRSMERTDVVPVIQDVTVSAWGLAHGVRAYARLRTRAAIGGREQLWPRAGDAFDALAAYIELDRERVRLRAGRQWKVSGLGYYNFDGASLLFRARPGLSAEAYGGWSLARGLNEPRTSESLAAIEAFAPDARALLIGVQLAYRPDPAFGFGALYQREIRDDRLGLYAERAAADVVWRWSRGSVTATLEADVAARVANDARINASYMLNNAITANGFARSYRPFFELWTIWGAFDPVGFREAGVSVSWRASRQPVELDVAVARRSYAETNASTVFGAYRSTDWSTAANAALRAASELLVQGAYRVDIGFGAARSEASLRVQRDLADGTYVAASAIAFQRQFELRVAEGTVYGLGMDGRLRLGPRSRLTGSLSAYRHHGARGEPVVDWSQFRGALQFEWTLGPEPGVAVRNTGER